MALIPKGLRVAALALVLLGGTSARAISVAPASAFAQEPSAAERVGSLLRQPAADGESTIAALVALGPAAIGPALDALRDGSVSDGEGRARLAPGSSDLVRKALSRIGRETVIAHLRDRVAFAEGPDDRRVAVEILCEVGSGEDLDLLFDAATPRDEWAGCDSRWTAAMQRSLERLFARDPSAIEPAARRLISSHADFAPALTRAIACSGNPAGFDLLVRSLGRSPALDLVLLQDLAKAEGRHASPLRKRALEQVRAHLSSTEPMLARTAAAACGELEDALAAPHLCELLGSADAQLVAAAHGSLKRLSGLAFAPQRERWQQWLQGEESWFELEAPMAIRQLKSEVEEEVLQALQALVQHPLHRDTFIAKVIEVTERSEPALRRFACIVLGRLRASTALPVLRELARHPSPELAQAAADAVRSIAPASK